MRYKKYIFAQMTDDMKEYKFKAKIILFVPEGYELEKVISLWMEDADLI